MCKRFVFTLQELNSLMQSLRISYAARRSPIETMESVVHAECLADHVLSYLNNIVDDVAIVSAMAMGYQGNQSIEGMGTLRNSTVRSDTSIAPIRRFVDELDDPGSWWDMAFRREQGARQLLVHHQHLVRLQAKAADGKPFEPQAVGVSPFASTPLAVGNLFTLLHDVLTKFFRLA
jgi:hypothetical protein